MGKHIKFEHVNTHGDFTAVLDHFGMDYEKKGPQLRALCPFHEDSNPSLSITLEPRGEAKENTWHCFGCKESGSIIDFAALMLGADLRAGAELVAEVSGCGLAPARAGTAKPKPKKPAKDAERPSEARRGAKHPSRNPSAEKAPEGRSDAPEAQSEPNQPLRFTLPLDPEHPYIAERVPPGLAFTFGLGICPETSRSMMAGRACVPIHDLSGQLIAYAGRYLGDDPKEPKWLLPKGFDKRFVLFNAHRVAGASTVVLVEGFFDAIRLHGLGIPALAVMGTAVSAEQVALLRDLQVRQVVVLFDGDDEGQAAVPGVVQALAAEVFVRAVSIPPGDDPASLEEPALLRRLNPF